MAKIPVKVLEQLEASGGRREFGIDWKTVLKCKSDDCKDYTLEECFDLPQDPELQEAGIMVCARVLYESGKSRNRIAFRKQRGEEGVVKCTHTAVCQMPVDEATGLLVSGNVAEFAKSLEGNREVDLPPEEHFKALRSYVAGIADMGITNIVLASYEGGDPGELPFGFNALMQKQVMYAIEDVAPIALDSVKTKAFWELKESTTQEWLESRFELLDERFNFAKLACKLSDPGFTSEVMLAGGAKKMIEECFDTVWEAIASDSVLAEHLAKDNDWDVRRFVARNPSTPPAVLEQLIGDNDWAVRKSVARNPNTPPAFLKQLTTDEIFGVRVAVAKNTNTPPALLEQLARDESWNVRRAVAMNNITPLELLEQLIRDKNADVWRAAKITAKMGNPR